MNLKHLDFGMQVKAVSEAGIFTGYGSVFDVVDSYNEIVMPGAFKKSLERHKAAGTMPALLWQHRSGEPAGVYLSMAEDENGLLVEGQLALKTKTGSDAYEFLKMRAVRGLSIGFVPILTETDQKTGITRILEAELWEISIVTFPANSKSTVHGVKSLEEIQDIRSLERHIRDVCGLSQREAVALIATVKRLARSDSSDDNELEQLAQALAKRNFN